MSSSPSRSGGGGPGPALSALIAEGLGVHPDEIARMNFASRYGDASSDDNSSDDTDDMPPLEDISRPVGAARRSEGEVEEIEAFGIRVLAPAPTRPSAAAAAASGSAAARAKPADASSDESSVVEIVDLPDVSSPTDHNMARRTRSHNDASSPSPARRRKPPAASANATGGLKTTGLESEDNLTPTRKKAGKKRSAEDDNDDVERDDQKKEAAEQHCSICLEPPARDEETRLNNCGHIFCFSCIETWAERENTCPLCKVRFTKIERVNKPPPSKRRKKGGGKSSGGKNAKKATKRIKARDQREDLLSANPLAGLFEHLEASGTMPRSIAQLIFSGLGGPNPFANMPNRTINVSARRRGSPAASSSRTEASGDFIIARNPTTGRFTRVPRERAASSSSSSPPATASASAARASSSRRSTRSASSSAAAAASSSGNGRPAFGSGAPPNVSVTLNSYGPTSLNLPGSPPPGFFSHSGRYPRGLGSLLFHDSDDEDDDDFVPRGESQYDTFVRRARSRSSPLRVSRREVPMPPTQPHLPPANTADTAIEIGDSDDDGGDNEVVVLDE